ncbi:MAG: alpha-ketoglutarate decarboxylase [Flavobacteriaceae bacterium]
MFLKYKLIIAVLLFTCTFSFSQNTSEPFMSHVRFGGTFNLGFGNNYTTIGISPSAIYDFNQQFSAGVSFSYLYSKGKYYPAFGEQFEASTNMLGGSLIALYSPINAFQLSAEFEQMHVNYKDDRFPESSEWIPAIYLGLAYNTGNIAFGMRYNVLFYSNNRSIYSSAFTPVFRVYF